MAAKNEAVGDVDEVEESETPAVPTTTGKPGRESFAGPSLVVSTGRIASHARIATAAGTPTI